MKRSNGLFGLTLGAIVITVIGLAVVGALYGYVHAKTVVGVVESIDNLTPSIVGNSDSEIKYSFAVSIESDEEIFSFSAEDRQWGSIKVGDKVEARAYPYAPWMFGKAGTYHGGRMVRKFKK